MLTGAPMWWNYLLWAVTVVLGGLVMATYVRRPGETRTGSVFGTACGGGLLTAFAVSTAEPGPRGCSSPRGRPGCSCVDRATVTPVPYQRSARKAVVEDPFLGPSSRSLASRSRAGPAGSVRPRGRAWNGQIGGQPSRA